MTIRQFVTFRLGNKLVGIDILQVREINRVLDVSPVEHAPAYVRGLINLRGQTVTVFDLGVRLGMPARTITPESHNIILKQDNVGLIVDAISDVCEARADEIEKPPANIAGLESEFITGVVKLKEELLVLLSAEKILEYHPGQAPKTEMDGLEL